jgi:hypothetical protein
VARLTRGEAGSPPEKRLDAAILQGMERDDGETAAGREQRLGADQPTVDLAELVVDVDAQRLERARRRVDDIGAALRCGGAAHDLGQFERAGDRPRGAGRHDGACDRPRPALLAIGEDEIGEIALVQLVDRLGGTRAGAVHAHVERAVGAERKAALGPRQLHRRNAEVERHAIGGGDTAQAQQFGHVAEAALDQLQAPGEAARQIGAVGDRLRIAVDAPHRAIRRLEQRPGITAAAEGAVDIDAAVARRQRLQHLAQQHRPMTAGG